MLLFGAFFLLYETILAIPSVQYLIVDILNEDLTLTGRTYIYTRMLDLMDTQPWFGYGNGTATNNNIKIIAKKGRKMKRIFL